MISKQQLIGTLNCVKQQAILGLIMRPDYGICKNWCEMLDDAFSYDLVGSIEQLLTVTLFLMMNVVVCGKVLT